jgi:hypothetical protein
MAVTIKLEPLTRDVQVLVGDLEGEAASELLATFAEEEIEDAKRINAAALGRVPPYKIFVDGAQGKALEDVRPNGVIVAEFELVQDVLIWIAEQLFKFSPVKSGLYQKSHELFADGKHVEALGQLIPIADEYIFVNTVPYARKIERGSSSQAPDGVYQAIAALARLRFGNIARTSYTFATLPGGDRNPAIVVKTNA